MAELKRDATRALRCPDDEASKRPAPGVFEVPTTEVLRSTVGATHLLRRSCREDPEQETAANDASDFRSFVGQEVEEESRRTYPYPNDENEDEEEENDDDFDPRTLNLGLKRTIDLRRVIRVVATKPPHQRAEEIALSDDGEEISRARLDEATVESGKDGRRRKRTNKPRRASIPLSLADITYPHPRPWQQYNRECGIFLKVKGNVGPLSVGSVTRWIPCEVVLDVVAVEEEDGSDRIRFTIFLSAAGQRSHGWRNIKLRYHRSRSDDLNATLFDPLLRARRWWAVHEAKEAARKQADVETVKKPWREITLHLLPLREYEILHQRGFDCALLAGGGRQKQQQGGEGCNNDVASDAPATTSSSSSSSSSIRADVVEDTHLETIVLRASSDRDAEIWLSRLEKSLSSRVEFCVAPASRTICERQREDVPELDAGDTKAPVHWIVRKIRDLAIDKAMYPEASSNATQVCVRWLDSSSLQIAYFCLFLDHLVMADMLSSLLPLCALGYMLVEYPRPHPKVWRVLLIYLCAVLSVKFAFQLPFFCENMANCEGTECTGTDQYTYSIQPYCLTCGKWESEHAYEFEGATCWANETSYAAEGHATSIVQSVDLVGIRKIRADTDAETFSKWFDYVACDVLAIVAILAHVSRLKRKGLWLSRPIMPTHLLSPRNKGRRLVVADEEAEGRNDVLEAARFAPSTVRKNRPPPRAAGSAAQHVLATVRDFDSFARDVSWPLVAQRLPVPLRMLLSWRFCPRGIREFFQRVLWRPYSATANWSNATAQMRELEQETRSSTRFLVTGLKKAATKKNEKAAATTTEGKQSQPTESKRVSFHRTTRHRFSGGARRSRSPSRRSLPLRKRGTDWFSFVFGLKIAAFLYIVFRFTAIKENGSNVQSKGVSAVLTDSTFSAGTIKATTLLLVDMIVDAVSYVNQDMVLKLALHLTEVALVHCWVFFGTNHLPFDGNAPLIEFYLLFLAIHFFSAAQIRNGFHPTQQLRLFTTGQYTFGLADKLSFYAYKFIPFVLELGVVLRWACTSTAMDLNMWFRTEAIIAKLFISKCEMVRRQRDGGFLNGRPRRGLEVCVGLFWFVVIIVVLVLPLWFFSSINPYTQSNRVVGATAKISIATTRSSGSTLYPMWSSDSSVGIEDFTSGGFVTMQNNLLDVNGKSIVQSDWSDQMQSIRLPMPATYEWTLSPPAKLELTSLLTDNDRTLYWRLDATFAHETVTESGTWFAKNAIDSADRTTLAEMIGGNETTASIVGIDQFYPRLLELVGDAATTGSDSGTTDINDVDTNVDAYWGAAIDLRSANGTTWWESWCSHDPIPNDPNEINCLCKQPPEEKNKCGDDRADAYRTDGIVFNVVWHPVSNGIAASLKSAFKATSVVTFYATIVLLVSGYIRSILWMPVADIMYYETPYPDDLLAVVDGITIARHMKHSGHLRDEIGLFNTLIRIYRRPEMLLRITKDKLDITRDKLE
eukprot:g89.t1